MRCQEKDQTEKTRLGLGLELGFGGRVVFIWSIKMYPTHWVFRSWPGVKPIITLKTATFVIRNTSRHCRIVSHQKWATAFLFMSTGDIRITIIIAKAQRIFHVNLRFHVNWFYLLEYFLGLLTTDSIVTVGYSDWKSHKQSIFKSYRNFWKHMFHIWTLYIQFLRLFK